MIISLLALFGGVVLVVVSIFECFRIIEQFEIINKNLELVRGNKEFNTIGDIDD